MSLDIEVFKVTKTDYDDSLVYNFADVTDTVFAEADLLLPMYRQVAPYTQTVRVLTVNRSIKNWKVCRSATIREWHDDHDVQKWFHEHLPEPVENGGFYILSAKTLSQYNKAYPYEPVAVAEPNEDEALFYWEGY